MVNVIVDEREYRAGDRVVREIKGLGCRVIPTILEVGDYVVSSDVAIERKTARDFIRSIIDGRLFEQAQSLKNAYKSPVLIVEGDLGDALEEFGVHKSAVLGAQVYLARIGIPMIYTSDPLETARAIYLLVKQEQESGKGVKVVRTRKRVDDLRELQIAFLSALPGIGRRRAEKLLKIYGTPMNALKNLHRWSTQVEGIGEKTMESIRKVLGSV